ncbi:MAG: biotin transporter BioY [Ruminococcus sp.]|jgi:biotin transport system substrate-specific component|nr:biotin transporter BioY [Ruminococcus sp.]
MKNIKLLTTAGIMTALTAVLANISIPFAGIVLTLGVFAVLLTGLLLPPKFAVLSVLAYLALGLAGVPVFAGFTAGAGVLFGPTGGFLIAYPVMAAAVSAFRNRNKIAGFAVALAVCYIFGGGWYCFWGNVDIITSLSLTVLPFIPFDIIKAVLSVAVSKPLLKLTADVKT